MPSADCSYHPTAERSKDRESWGKKRKALAACFFTIYLLLRSTQKNKCQDLGLQENDQDGYTCGPLNEGPSWKHQRKNLIFPPPALRTCYVTGTDLPWPQAYSFVDMRHLCYKGTFWRRNLTGLWTQRGSLTKCIPSYYRIRSQITSAQCISCPARPQVYCVPGSVK